MLAYRHAFHAGNHADVLKHIVLACAIRRFLDKDKPFTVIDTHAGAGGYSLQGAYAHKTGEYGSGVGRLWSEPDLPAPLARYVDLVREFNGGGELEQVPGSPAIAKMLLRAGDRLRLFELHPTDYRILDAFLGKRAHTQVTLGDGFAALAAELPPPSRRGMVLIDPPYEIKTDYARVVGALRDALRLFATGTVLIWYPILQIIESSGLPRRLQAAASEAPKGWLLATLKVRGPGADGFGMLGSGVFVANPPFTLKEELAVALPALAARLGQDASAGWALESSPGV